MFKYKLTNVSKLVEQIALSGIDFVVAAMNPANNVKMEINKSVIFANQAEITSMMVKALAVAIEKDEAAIIALVPDPLLN